ncbi:dimethylhistidine N-methyltransferase [Marmoricola sp. Leaf446]|uniref:L-histidine N(alpha)-methyltransferase n=1 Tax=Marmoricola sp. Leaf446 TaxID=1736379 RepID=UPI0006FB6202|nr:L-histidine N(alpha)-methyltransferase [Marmoricola sp. Leaf446]KQT89226.1 dimethylhistidine N-methyltransferase [Marmoricola sp. Leaf446]
MPILPTEVHLAPGALADQMADDVRAGLTAMPRTIPPKYFYDARGSLLFDEITRLPEYYPTRTERAILEEHAKDVALATEARSLVELGSGTSEKTRLLLDALRDTGTLETFVPLDVDPAILAEAAAAVAQEYPGVTVAPVVADFERHLTLLPRHPRRLLAFLGSTIGNLDPDQRADFLGRVRATLVEGDAFLLGTDLVKAEDRLVAAYDDAAGVTAQFDLNVLRVLQRELGAELDPDAFEHRAVWVAEEERIEMRLESVRDQTIRIGALDLDVELTAGEQVRTEISTKFRREGVERELAAAGLRLTHWWTDAAGDFALSLSVPG